MRSQASGGGRGLGAGAHPGGEEASATREKTRSVGSEHASVRGDYVFDRAMKNPTPATKVSVQFGLDARTKTSVTMRFPGLFHAKIQVANRKMQIDENR